MVIQNASQALLENSDKQAASVKEKIVSYIQITKRQSNLKSVLPENRLGQVDNKYQSRPSAGY